MHIAEGILAGTPHGQQLLLAGAALAAAGTAMGLRKLDYEKIPRAAVLSSAFFVISLIHVPLGPTYEHLVLSGLMGLVLGWAVFPAVLVALLLQAVFFSYGGLTTLGLNTFVMALPAVVCNGLFRRAVCSDRELVVSIAAFSAGASAILLAGLLNAGVLMLAGESFQFYANLVALFHLPLAGIEGLVTASVVVLLRKVRPELLQAPLLKTTRTQVSGMLIWAAAIVLCAPASASAHQMNLYATVEGRAIQGEVYFRGKVPAQNVTVRLLDPDGQELDKTTTDEQGKFTFPNCNQQNFQLVANSEDGHGTEPYCLPAALFAEGAATTGSAVDGASARSANGSELAPPSVEALRAQIDLLKQQIIDYQSQVRVRDVLGGVGWIVGIAGVAFYFLGARRKGRNG
jgi:cobalt/nickel transport system permease protein